ncbi:hypothetical protein J2S40_001539 [Nocardioides luteus]|uniref:SAV-6107-like HEPN domain-containing protein n=2 Tax=Nocardioides luteus TaxID=1844 RepID=A0ABQ5T1D7_9ACTN|nr:hypothetical protein [Nocardioides luteus]MDR7310481.1 hypothetical protein [Nocardioides luteus]GGR73690.1 hypothetical protein GCM10010197_46220 [Nocardioides luteus]GLJ69738.1 hypothetical protein GCM10017579_37740 [Nocardioides luteus]
MLDAARAQLNQSDPHANRRAAWLARAAAEDAIGVLLAAKQLDPGRRANGRTLLSCLEALYRDDAPAVANHAQYAWSRLSEACHQHAYEMSPTHAEIAHLIDLVARLNQHASSQSRAKDDHK